jgi:hypothetical protein
MAGVCGGKSGGGTVKYQRSAEALLEPVRKVKTDCGASKNWQEVLVKTARPSGRMRRETPNRVWEREESGKKTQQQGDVCVGTRAHQ